MKLDEQIITIPGIYQKKFDINPFKKECIINGIDEIDYLVNLRPDIETFENTFKMKSYNITILQGDGIGPEIIGQAIKVLEACAETTPFTLNFNHELIGAASIDQSGHAITDETLTSCISSDAVLLGAIGDPKYDHDPTLKVRPEQGLLKLRQSLGLFANIRPLQIYSSID